VHDTSEVAELLGTSGWLLDIMLSSDAAVKLADCALMAGAILKNHFHSQHVSHACQFAAKYCVISRSQSTHSSVRKLLYCTGP
jgi:hypothetical protein